MSDSPNDFRSKNLPIVDWIDGDLGDEPSPSQGPEDAEVARQLVLHSLLTNHFESTQSRESRIQLAMDAFEQLPSDSSSATTSVEPNIAPSVATGVAQIGKTSPVRTRFMFVATTAATILLAVGVWGLLAPLNAEAALSRVIAATQVPVTRIYDATIRRRVLRRDVDRKATLYSRSIDRFAADFHSNRLQKPFWIGFDGQERWFVTEDRQWSSADNVELPRDALIDLVTLKNMQFNALLTRIPQAFHVKLLPQQTISIDGRSFDCRPLEATTHRNARGLPDTIRIWPHPDTGVVLQMHVINEDPGPLGVRLIELQLSGEQEVPENFFSLEYHRTQNADE